MSSKWFINRVGLLNFWYYQNQIFQLADGRMLLRGTNGSGKSLTMQSLFPVLFDGDTSAYRLDSFGSRDRKMEDYLLGEKGVSNRDEGTGYLFLEAKREDRDEYLTIGIGMHANRGGKLAKWFFAIENNQRVDIDFYLYDEIRKNEIKPLSKQQLKNRLEGVGRYFDTQRDYKFFVNERLFGFKELSQFDELISLLINLRSPKLSKDFRPTVIYNILRDSLPKLKDEELITLSKTIEQIDSHRERMEDLERELKELNRFSKVYKQWQDEFTGQMAGKWLDKLQEKRQLNSKKRKQLETQYQLEITLKNNEIKGEETELELDVLERSISELSQHSGMDLVHRGQELKDQLQQIVIRFEKEKNSLDRKTKRLFEQKEKIEQKERGKYEYVTELEDFLEDNLQYLTCLGFEELDKSYSKKMRSDIRDDEFTYWKEQVKNKKEHFYNIKNQLNHLERIQEQLREMERELGDIQLQVDGLERDSRHWQQLRQTEIEKWKSAFEEWTRTKTFSIKEVHYAQVLYRIDQLLEEDIREEYIYESLTLSYQEAIKMITIEKVELENNLNQHKLSKEALVAEVKRWRTNKIPEPIRSVARMRNREQLVEKNYTIFFQAVDFKDFLSEKERNTIEGALFASGILDSLLASDGLILEDDIQIHPKVRVLTSTLHDVLKVEQNLSRDLKPIVEDILQSILLDELDPELPSIMRDGSYYIANLSGKMATNYQASYIGAASQEQFRQRRILELEKNINIINNDIAIIELDIERVVKYQEDIANHYEQRPSGAEVYQAIQEKTRTNLVLKTKLAEHQKKEKQVNDTTSLVNYNRNELNRITKTDGIVLIESAYEEAYHYADNYSANLDDAYKIHHKIKNNEVLIFEIQKNISIQEEEESDLQLVMSGLIGDQRKLGKLIEENLKQQKIMNVEQLQEKLSRDRFSQKILKEQQIEINKTITTVSSSKAKNELELDNTLNLYDKVAREEEFWNQLFSKEYDYKKNREQALEEVAKQTKRELNIQKFQNLENGIIQEFNYLADSLQNYQPKLMDVTIIELSKEIEQEIVDFTIFNHYKQPKFSLEGQASLVFDLLEQLMQQKLTLQDLLKKDDEALFKKIILESIGNILRSRINQAVMWVDQMNELLQSQKNSSGLTLSIQWKGVPSTSENDLGTNKLVELLQKDTRILSEADQEAISRHFQEKVRYAQEIVQENEDERSTLFQAISQVLDYRDWFVFELKFKRSNIGYQSQVLTDRRFNQFSGGEKAVAMYLPLFTAVHSRYKEAEDFCPKIITLDEAFAGIDDSNISELFKACEQLDFNYVMNSQALYGEYETVSKLMIYELIRPQNANIVSAVRYYWNGKTKEMILEGFNE